MSKNLTKAIRLNDDDLTLFKSYANAKGITFSELCKSAVREKIDDELDLQCANESYADYLSDKTTISHEELFKSV